MADNEAKFSRLPILLPLLHAPSSAPNALAPPLHLLPGGSVGPSRIILEQSAPSSGQVDLTSAATGACSNTRRGSTTTWISTNHVFPAAYPRSHPASTAPITAPIQEPLPLPLDASEAKIEESRRRQLDLADWERRINLYSREVEALEPATSEEEAERIARDLAARAFPQLWATVQRIVPLSEEGLVQGSGSDSKEPDGEEVFTLLFAHANGFHKETWEQTIRVLVQTLSTSTSRVRIEEIWSLDTMGSGESGPLNRGSMGELLSWFDGARDIIQFLDHYLPVTPLMTTGQAIKGSARPATFGPEWLPTTLKATAKAKLPSPDMDGQSKRRRIIAVGHSYSGATLSCVAGIRPDLLEGLILVDPVLFHHDLRAELLRQDRGGLNLPLATGAVARKDVWSDRQHLLSYLTSKPFFASWDRSVLSSYVRFGTYPLSTSPSTPSGQTLNMSKWSEAAYFATTVLQSPFALAALRTQQFKGKIHHFTMDTYSVQDNASTEAINDTIFKVGGTFETLKGGHLVVQEQPNLIGHKLAEVMQRWCDSSIGIYHPPHPRL